VLSVNLAGKGKLKVAGSCLRAFLEKVEDFGELR